MARVYRTIAPRSARGARARVRLVYSSRGARAGARRKRGAEREILFQIDVKDSRLTGELELSFFARKQMKDASVARSLDPSMT